MMVLRIVAISFYLQLFISIKADSTGVLRLYRNGVADTSQSWSSGIVQIYYSGRWGNICDDSSFGSDEADVICHQLGYTGASLYSNTGNTTTWGSDDSSTVMDDVSCSTSSYLTITQCSFSTFISSTCNNSRDVIVTCSSFRIWDSPRTGDIRLTGGTYSNQGLLEVYCNGQWGTVCDDLFFITEARIACAQLGYNDYEDYDHLSQRGNSSQSIWLDTTSSCSSTTDTCLTSFGSCPTTAVTICIHSEDITLSCEYSTIYSKETVQLSSGCDDVSSQGVLRLYRNGVADTNQSWSSGIVQIYYSGQWGNICDDINFGSDEADVICHQLGYTGASSYSNTGTTTIWGSDSSPTVLDDVSCSTSTYLTVTQCSFETSIDSSCTISTDVIVTCSSTRIWDSPSAGDIRLTGGNYSNQGLLEVYCNGQWGTVCDDSFSTTEARIACAQLGYNDYEDYNHLSQRGSSSQPIWLDTTSNCSLPNDTCLTSCGTCPMSAIDHTHSEDVTLSCEYDSETSKVSSDHCRFSATSEVTNTSSIWIIMGVIAAVIILLVLIGFAVGGYLFIVQYRKKKRQKEYSSRIAGANPMQLLGKDAVTDHTPTESSLHDDINTFKSRTTNITIVLQSSLIDKDNLKLIDKVGEGEFGIVYRGLLTVYVKKEAEIQSVAVKTLKGRYSQTQTDQLMVEAKKMVHFNHLNVLSLTGVCVGLLDSPCLVMPFMSNGSLLSYLRKEAPNLIVSELADENLLNDTIKRLLSMCLQVAKGMAYLAEQRFIHRDLAARNCMISADNIIKVADFGLAEDVYTADYFIQERSLNGSVKLPIKWMALESIHYGTFTEKTDVWSYGVLCWEVFSGGKSPYPAMSPKEVLKVLDSGERLSKPLNPACTDEISKFISTCWAKSPDARPHFSDIVLNVEQLLSPLAEYLEFSDDCIPT